MPVTDPDAGRVARYQRAGNAQFFLVAQQAIGIACLECEAEYGAGRTQRDIAFRPVDIEAQDFAAFMFTLADDPVIGHRAGIGTGIRAGQGKRRYFLTLGEAREVVIFLLVRAVMHQQFARAQRVGHHDGDPGGQAAAGDFHDHFRLRPGRKLQAAVFFRDDHAEKLVFPDAVPGFFRQIVQIIVDMPVIQGCTKFCDRPFDESLFFVAEFRYRNIQQFLPVWLATEQIAIPPDGTGVYGFFFRAGHWRQN